jgi:hypothetical protein
MYYTQECHIKLKLKIQMRSREMFKCVKTFDRKCSPPQVVAYSISHNVVQFRWNKFYTCEIVR